jgi:hypothetical protein
MVVTDICCLVIDRHFNAFVHYNVDGTVKNGRKTRWHVQLYMGCASFEMLTAGQLRRPFSEI